MITFLLPALLNVTSSVTWSPPHVILIMADDLGWNDVGWHNPRMHTPHLDDLARSGVILNNFYSMHVCSPSRAALLTGRYPASMGVQHVVFRPAMAAGLPLEFELLPQMLKRQGYSTHALGKWHLGYHRKEYLPQNRGFDTFFGSYSGGLGSYDHVSCFKPKKMGRQCGYDWHLNNETVFNASGVFGTHSVTVRAQRLIAAQPRDKPLFMYLAYHAPHAPLEVPAQYLRSYMHTADRERRIFGGMMTCLDEGIANVTASLKKHGLYDNSVIIFLSDNGGQVTAGGNNYPLRGWKNSLFEGGVRVPAFVHSPLLPRHRRGSVSNATVHISDWAPTILRLAGDKKNRRDLDGMNIWEAIRKGGRGPRREMLYNIDHSHKLRGDRNTSSPFDDRIRAGLRLGHWKLLTGQPGNKLHVPDPEDGMKMWEARKRETCLFVARSRFCKKMRASIFCRKLRHWCQYKLNLTKMKLKPARKNKSGRRSRGKREAESLRRRLRRVERSTDFAFWRSVRSHNPLGGLLRRIRAALDPRNKGKPWAARNQRVWLFNLRDDPYEERDKSLLNPHRVRYMLQRLQEHYKRSRSPIKRSISLAGDPRANGGIIQPFL